MKLLVEPVNKNRLYLNEVDGVILPLEGYAVESNIFFSMEEIEKVCIQDKCEVFVKINKNLMNNDIENVKDILLRLDKMKVKGIFFYDLAILQLKRELNLSVNLVWNQTHMVNNYKTCDYYYDKGVRYALLGKEITLDEILEIINNSQITCMVEVVSKPSVAFSKRKLVSNYYKNLQTSGDKKLTILEKVSNKNYQVVEEDDGTSFYLDEITNGTVIIKDLYEAGCDYIIFREYGLEDCFLELVKDTRRYISDGCVDLDYVSKYRKLGDSTNFFFKKTIYRVKKNG